MGCQRPIICILPKNERLCDLAAVLCLTSEVSCRLQALEEPLRMHHLPELRRLSLEGDRPDNGTLHFDNDSFLGTCKLEYLSVHRRAVVYHAGQLRGADRIGDARAS